MGLRAAQHDVLADASVCEDARIARVGKESVQPASHTELTKGG